MKSGLNRIKLNQALRCVEGGQTVEAVADQFNVRAEYLQQFVAPPKKKRAVKKKAEPAPETPEADED